MTKVKVVNVLIGEFIGLANPNQLLDFAELSPEAREDVACLVEKSLAFIAKKRVLEQLLQEADGLDPVCPNDVRAIIDMWLPMSVLLPADAEKVRGFRAKVKFWTMISH